MEKSSRIILIKIILLAVVVIASVVAWKLVEKYEMNKNIESGIIKIGMSEKDVFRIWGDPDETVDAPDLSRTPYFSTYAYDLDSGERLLLSFFEYGLVTIHMIMPDNTDILIAGRSRDGVCTQIYVDFSTGEYEVISRNS